MLKTPVEPQLHLLNVQEEAINFTLQKIRSHVGYHDHSNIQYIRDPFPSLDEEIPSVSVIIPAINKDAAILPFTIQSVRKNLAAKIRNIAIVTDRRSHAIRQIAKESGAEVVCENDFLCDIVNKEKIQEILLKRKLPRHHSNGWLLQQFIKLAGFKDHRDFFTIDADTVLTKKYSIRHNNSPIFREWGWRESHYCYNYKELMGLWPITYFTTVHHMMYFDGDFLHQLKTYLENRYNTGWVDAILGHIPNDDFSEYTLYSQWALRHKNCYLADVNQQNIFSVDLSQLKTLESIENKYRYLDAVSFHNSCS